MTTIRSFLLLLAFTNASASAITPSLSIRRLWIDAPTQSITLTYSTDTGFPLGSRYAQSTLDCRTGKITTRGYEYGGSRDPEVSPEDKDAPAAIAKTKLITLNPGAMSYRDYSAQPRFFCKNGLLVSDLSSYARNDRALMIDVMYSDTNLNINAGLGEVKLTLPGFVFRREDDKLATATLSLAFNGNSLSTVNALTSASTNAPLSRPREALFLLEKDGVTLRPLVYNGQEPGLRTAFPVKAGKNGSVVMFYYTEDYNGAIWQKTVLDLTTGQTYTTKTTRPTKLKFGQ